jgi:hypothetical protein
LTTKQQTIWRAASRRECGLLVAVSNALSLKCQQLCSGVQTAVLHTLGQLVQQSRYVLPWNFSRLLTQRLCRAPPSLPAGCLVFAAEFKVRPGNAGPQPGSQKRGYC